MKDALSSNAGDRYHFVYVARRMLDMLFPRNNLKLIQMENVAEEDRLFADSEETYLGVDLTEYYGSTKSDDAEKVIIIQVKYSPTNPNAKWTLNRLIANKYSKAGNPKPGTSVLRKLANPLNAFYSTYGESTSERLQIKLYTNQLLENDLKEHLLKVQTIIKGKKDSDGLKYLRKTKGELREILDQIKKTTNLNWNQLTAFLKCWDISSFGQAILSDAETELYELLSQYTSDDGIQIGGLIAFVQEHAMSNRPTNITPKKVYAQLRLREMDFFPAPTHFFPDEKLLFTKEFESIMESIEEIDKGILLLHGGSGTGKSTAIQMLSQRYGDGNLMVIYDCFAGGKGFQPGSERFPFNKCFVQIINELDALFHTNIIATTRLNYNHLMYQFNNALTKAAQIAQRRGYRLIVAIDAVDNAIDSAIRAPVQSANSFVPILWKVNLPDNCIVIVTSRTENIPDLAINCQYKLREIKGFTQNETKSYIRSYWPDVTNELVEFVHNRTNGNPRVQAKLIERAKYESPSNILNFVSSLAKETAIKYYKAECPKRLEQSEDMLMLAVILEAKQSISLETLANILQRPINDIKVIIDKLYFGLKILNNNEILWKDQDFFEFSKTFVENYIDQVRQILVDYCHNNYGDIEYATSNISYHMYMSKNYEELVNWWLGENRLYTRIREVEPHSEIILEDIQYSLLAAIKIDQFSNALKLLFLAANILQGKNVFTYKIRNHPQIAFECNYLNRLLDFLYEQESDYELANHYFVIARVLSEHSEQINLAEDLIQRGIAIIKQESEKNNSSIHGFDIEHVIEIGLFEANAYGLKTALENMQKWQPQDNVYLVYSTLIQKCSYQQGERVHQVIESTDLNDYQRAYSLMGLLSAQDAQLPEDLFRKVAETVLGFFKSELLEQTKCQEIIPVILENLLSLELKQLGQDLFQYWQVPKPNNRFASNMFEYLKFKAIETVLDINTFNPDDFDLGLLPGNTKNPEIYKPESNQKVSEIRSEMQKQFPSILCRTRAIFKAPQEEVITEIQNCLEPWLRDVECWWYEPQHEFIHVACRLLEAVIHLPNYHYNLVDQVCDTADRVLSSDVNRGYLRYADILSQDSRYLAQAERLIRKRRQELNQPIIQTKEALESLLSLSLIASRFESELANNLFTDARLAANNLDIDIYHNLSALIKIASYTMKEIEFKNEQLVQLISIFEFINKVTPEYPIQPLQEVLYIFGHTNPSLAFNFIEKLDQSDILDFERSIYSVTLGLLDSKVILPEVIFAITQFLINNGKGIDIFYKSISQLLDNNKDIENFLQSFAKYLRTKTEYRFREEELQKFINWTTEHGLKNNPTVQSMERYAKELGKLKITKVSGLNFTKDYIQESCELFTDFLENMKTSPQYALKKLIDVAIDERKKLSEDEIEEIINKLIKSLPSGEIHKLISIIETWISKVNVPKAFSLLVNIAEHLKQSGKPLACIEESFQKILTPAAIHQLTYEYNHEYLYALLDCQIIEVETKFRIILSAVVNSLREFKSEEIHQLIGHLGILLPQSEAYEVFDNILQKFVDKLPEVKAIEQKSEIEPVAVLVNFLSNRLGEPRQSIRWRAMYTLVDMILNKPEPTLTLLIGELNDKKHERWITKMEWILFVIHHLSLRIPCDLKVHALVFKEHAMNVDFPHAKIRYHAKEILLNIEKSNPGVFTADDLTSIQMVNEPIKYITRDDLDNMDMSYENTPWNQKSDILFNFDTLNTLPYWYSPLGHCFSHHRCHVADIAYKWIVKRWGITNEMCIEEQYKNHNKYDWRETNNDHGNEPSIETLKLYAERHGMFMAAGELIDSKPVFFESKREGDRWHEWIRYQLRAADQTLPGRFIDAPPLVADNYGIFESDYTNWVKKNVEKEFRNELFLTNQPDWLVVAGRRRGTFGDRQFEVKVMSTLVDPKKSRKLASLICNWDGYVPLPYINACYDTVLSEFEFDLVNRSDFYIYPQNKIKDDDEFFGLKSWLVYWHQEMPFHTFDSKWPEFGRDFYFPTIDFYTNLELSRESTSLSWLDITGETVGYHEIWHNHDSENEYTDGYRLIMRQDKLCDYLKKVGLDMILVVTLSRQKSYQYQLNNKEYDLGTKRTYILTSEEQLQNQIFESK